MHTQTWAGSAKTGWQMNTYRQDTPEPRRAPWIHQDISHMDPVASWLHMNTLNWSQLNSWRGLKSSSEKSNLHFTQRRDYLAELLGAACESGLWASQTEQGETGLLVTFPLWEWGFQHPYSCSRARNEQGERQQLGAVVWRWSLGTPSF